MSFENIIGNNKIKEFLNQAVEEGHVSHSYLFIGINGIGKTLFAREFAKKVLCLNGKGNNCESCLKWENNNHPDFVQINPENNVIKIEQIRNMQEEISVKPIASNKKVFLIIDSDLMTKEAQNCLLKTLEEPPQYALIILTTSNESKLLNTIKSRCMKIPFERIDEKEITDYANNVLNISASKDFIKMCEGSIGKLLEIKEDEELYTKINTLLENIEGSKFTSLINNAEVLYKGKEKITEILEYINVYLYNQKDMKKLKCIKYVEEVKKRLLANSNYDMCIDYLLMNLWEEINEKYSRS